MSTLVTPNLPAPSAEEFAQHCATTAWVFGKHIAENDLGHIMTNESLVKTRMNPDTVRGADLCYFSYERLPRGEVTDGLLPTASDLVVEVRSPSESWLEMYAKVSECLGAGVRVVIILDAASVSASVYRPTELPQIFKNSDQLVVPDVLPGFAVVVSRLFE